MVPADSRRISRVPRYSGACLFNILRISPKGLSPAMARLSSRFGYPGYRICRQVLQPRMMRCHISGLGSSAFARHYLRNHCYFLFLRVLRCFSSPGSPLRIQQIPESLPVGCPIRKSAAQWVFAPPRGLSQLVTSFFASESQGILHVPFSPFLFLKVFAFSTC